MLGAPTSHRGGGRGGSRDASGTRRPHSRNRAWTPGDGNTSGGERWERGGHRGGGGGRARRPNMSWRKGDSNSAGATSATEDVGTDGEENEGEESEAEAHVPPEEPVLETMEEREAFYKELVKAREAERKKAIAEGKMDDPLVPKRLEDAITMVGTCMDMCPRFERYRRERENHLDKLETIPGTKRVDHRRAVKIYERAAGDKTLPSDLRPPTVLKRTLNYLFRELIAEHGFSVSQAFVRDRSRAVRNDFTMQHETGALAIECHDRCARFHILALHLERDKPGFSVDMEDQQLMNTLQSLKEFYEDQRGRYESPTELEMRIYHRLIHIRDQKERHDDIPSHIAEHPVFKLTTAFRQHVQKISAPISKKSALLVDAEGMQIFGELAQHLRQSGNVVMIYLVACILERHFGKGTIEDIESIPGALSLSDIIDGVSTGSAPVAQVEEVGGEMDQYEDLTDIGDAEDVGEDSEPEPAPTVTAVQPGPSGSAFGGLFPAPAQASPFGSTSAFGTSSAPSTTGPASAFASITSGSGTKSVFGTTFPVGNSNGPTSAFGTAAPPAQTNAPTSAFGGNAFTIPPASSTPPTNIAPPAAPTPPTSSLFPQSVTAPGPTAPAKKTPVLNPSAPSFVSIGTNPMAAPAPPAAVPSFTQTKPAPTSQPATASKPFTLPARPPTFVPPPTIAPIAREPTFIIADNVPTLPPTFLAAPAAPPTQTAGPPTATFSNAQTLWELPGSIPKPPQFPTGSALKIDTGNLGLSRPGPATSQASFMNSPKEPPMLDRRPPLSLPPTPTLAAVSPPRKDDSSRNPGLFLNFDKLTPEKDILSPLIPPTPGVAGGRPLGASGSSSFSAFGPPPSATAQPSISRRVLEENAKRKEREKEALQAQALEFAKKGPVMQARFRKWLKKTRERVAYAEAIRRSEAYARKMENEKQRRSSSPKKRPRELDEESTASESTATARHKWSRKKRVSSAYKPPQTDEALAARLKENQDEHERRWAPGTFLNTIRSRLTRSDSSSPVDWHIWLSMNPENDGTAIWLERKFNVPTSGTWTTKSVFSIPLSPASSSAVSTNSPGLIVFECTPLDGLDDELERKYRVLDDCSRLRDALAALPDDRRFLPSLILIIWGEPEKTGVPADMNDMAKKCMSEDIIADYVPFIITTATKDVDSKFVQTMDSLTLDTAGRLARPYPVQDVYEQLLRSYRAFASGWASRCADTSAFNWHLYSVLFNASISLLNAVVAVIYQLWEAKFVDEPLEPIDFADVDTDQDAKSTTLTWLRRMHLLPTAKRIMREIEQSSEFPAALLLDWIPGLALDAAFARSPTISRSSTRLLSKKAIDEAIAQLRGVEQDFRDELNLVQAMPPPRLTWTAVDNQGVPLKRRMSQLESDLLSETSANEHSNGTQLKENGSKRQKVNGDAPLSSTMAVDPPELPNGRDVSPVPTDPPSPSPSASTTAGDSKPPVTIAMLRALTQSVRKKYAA